MATREQVLHVARLAKLSLSPEEEERFCDQLVKILDFVEQLGEVDELADERTHVAVLEKAGRPDEPRPVLPREEILALAPQADDETFHVPAVIEGGSSA